MCKINFNSNEIFNYLFLKLSEDRVMNSKKQKKYQIHQAQKSRACRPSQRVVGKLQPGGGSFLRYLYRIFSIEL
jgi:hypothetical protein